MSKNKELSIVVPVYECEDSLAELYKRLAKTLEDMNLPYEIILVDDGDPSNAWKLICELAQKDKNVKGIKLSRNFGQHPAISAGLENSNGQWIVVMDGDLQHKPEDIPKLYSKALKGKDIVFAKRSLRKDNFWKILSSKLFYKVFSYLTDTTWDSSATNFGIYKKRVIKAVMSMPESQKYFPVMVRWVGFESSEIELKHEERTLGKSSYTFTKLISLSINIMLSFSVKPLSLMIRGGFFISFISTLVAVYLVVNSYIGSVEVEGWTSVMVSVWFLGGLMISIIGLVGYYVGLSFNEAKKRPIYIVSETTGDNFKE